MNKKLITAAVAGGTCLIGGIAGLSHLLTAVAVSAVTFFYCHFFCKGESCKTQEPTKPSPRRGRKK